MLFYFLNSKENKRQVKNKKALSTVSLVYSSVNNASTAIMLQDIGFLLRAKKYSLSQVFLRAPIRFYLMY